MAEATAHLRPRVTAIGSEAIERVAVLVVLVLAFLSRIPTLGHALDEWAHPFRQTQTAYTALLFHQNGIDLFHAKLPVLGPPFEVPLEFPLFQALSSLVMDVGVQPDLAVRLTALGFFLVTAGLVWAVTRRVASRTAAFAALVMFVTSPFGLIWSRAEMIEYMATAGALVWVLCGISWRDRGGRLIWLVATIGGSVAVLVKITSGVYWVLPLLAYVPLSRPGLRSQVVAAARAAALAVTHRSTAALRAARADLTSLAGLAAMIGIPAGLAMAWTAYADQVKAAGSPITATLTSSALVTWNFGTLEQRLDPRIWAELMVRILTEFGGPLAALFFVGVVVCLRVKSQRPFWIAVIGATVLPLLTFFNLYAVHDYYLAAVSPGMAMVQGMLIAYLLAPARTPIARAVGVAIGMVVLVGSLMATQIYWGFMYRPFGDPSGALAEARDLARFTSPADYVLVEGRDWSPEVMYNARRWGLAVPQWVAEDDRVDLIDPSLYKVASLAVPQYGHMELLQRWPVVGALGPQTYSLGRSTADLRGASLYAADASAAPVVPPGAKVLAVGRVTLMCDGSSHPLPMGASGTRIDIGGSPPQTARIALVSNLGPVPARDVVIAAPLPGGATVTAAMCFGAESLTLDRILDTPFAQP